MSIVENLRRMAAESERSFEDWQMQLLIRMLIQRLTAPTTYLPGAPVGPYEFPRDPIPVRDPIRQHRFFVWQKAAYPAFDFDEQGSLDALGLDPVARASLADECDFIREFTPAAPVWRIPDDPFPGRGWITAEPGRTSQPRIPKPSTTPPMWANDVNRSRRPRRNRNQPTRQGIQ